MMRSQSRVQQPVHPPSLYNKVIIKDENRLKVGGLTLNKEFTYQKHSREAVARARQQINFFYKAGDALSDPFEHRFLLGVLLSMVTSHC